MLTKILIQGEEHTPTPKEGDLYKEVTVADKTFKLLYGYYENFERESPFNEPMPIYPDFIKEPHYTAEGIPAGLCKAKRLTYITTAGGNFVPEEFGPGYVKCLAQSFYGIPEFRLIKAVGLDLDGADADSIMHSAKADAVLKKS